MTQPDTRPRWEIEYCLRLNFASTYLDMMAATGIRRQFIVNAYGANGANGDLDQWCRDRIDTILAKCQQLVADNGPLSMCARGVVRDCAERLREMGLFGNAPGPDVGTTRTDQSGPGLDNGGEGVL